MDNLPAEIILEISFSMNQSDILMLSKTKPQNLRWRFHLGVLALAARGLRAFRGKVSHAIFSIKLKTAPSSNNYAASHLQSHFIFLGTKQIQSACCKRLLGLALALMPSRSIFDMRMFIRRSLRNVFSAILA